MPCNLESLEMLIVNKFRRNFIEDDDLEYVLDEIGKIFWYANKRLNNKVDPTYEDVDVDKALDRLNKIFNSNTPLTRTDFMDIAIITGSSISTIWKHSGSSDPISLKVANFIKKETSPFHLTEKLNYLLRQGRYFPSYIPKHYTSVPKLIAIVNKCFRMKPDFQDAVCDILFKKRNNLSENES